MPQRLMFPAPAAPALVALALSALVLSCSPGPDPSSVATETAPGPVATQSPPQTDEGQVYPDVTEAALTRDSDGTFTAAVTISSPYDSPQRYADAWRLLSLDRQELGVRVLTHDHAGEQPFTRSQSGIVIPDDVAQVIVQGRDLANGWGGTEITVDVPH